MELAFSWPELSGVLQNIPWVSVLQHLSIPLIAALIGWITNWVAVKLMFYPLDFVGIKMLRLGWQGVVPSKAEKMSKIVVRKGVASLASITEVYQRLDHTLLAERMRHMIDNRIESYIDELMMIENAVLWENTPQVVKTRLYRNVRKELPKITTEIVKDLDTQIESLFDLERMVCRILTNDKSLLNAFFLKAGKDEFSFIVRSGWMFGFGFGLIQMVLWFFFPVWWVLPLFGLLVGYATNSIALAIIFEPVDCIRLGPFKIQGLFLQRQKEVAYTFCQMTTSRVITVSNILMEMFEHDESGRVKKMLHHRIGKAVDNVAGMGIGILKPFTQAVLGARGYASLKNSASDLAYDMTKEELQISANFDEGQTEIIDRLLRDRMSALSPVEFRDVLRPAFEEDEWILVLVGAFLGMGAGIIQLFFVFGYHM